MILLVSPLQCVYFVIFIFLLQQLDGNVIGPKILGNSTGVSAFGVVFSILIGGGLFGFIGMIMAVPTYALGYYVLMMFTERKLEKKNLPLELDHYDEFSYVNEHGVYVKSKATKTGEVKSNEENC